MDRGSLAGLSPWGRKEADTTEQLKHNAQDSNTHFAQGKIEAPCS